MTLHQTSFRTSIRVLAVAAGVAPAVASAADEAQRVPERNEIEAKYLWATETIFADADAWETEFKSVEQDMEKVAAATGTLSKGPDELLAFLKARDALEPRLERVYVYASLRADQDTRVGENQGRDARASSLMVRYGQKMSWMVPELTSIPRETVESWMKENEGLALYEHYFDDLYRQKKYVLSPREEELMALAGEVRRAPNNAYNLLCNADIQFPTITDEKGATVELDDSAYYLYLRSNDRRVRKDAYNAIIGTYAKFRNSSAALLSGAVQGHIYEVKARGYDNCLQAALFDGNIPTSVYSTLVETVNRNLPLMHRYQEIRKRALKLEDGVHAYDLFAPLVEGATPEYTYEQAKEIINQALQPLGEQYRTVMNKGFDSRWVDVFPTKGKRSGAYSSGTFLTQPYILLNFHGGYEDVSTLAHEMGHSMHSSFSRGTQPYIYADYDIFCAEVASTCNEILLQNYILKQTTDPKVKLYLLVEFLEGIRGTVFRQTLFSEFEQKIHEAAEASQPLTADTMSAAFGEIMKKYYGPMYVHDDLSSGEWIRVPHFYYNFYVYKYATSYCAASNIARRIMAGEPGAVDGYMAFLHAGSHKYPLDVLKLAGVDMNSPQPVEDAMKIFESLLDQVDELLKQM